MFKCPSNATQTFIMYYYFEELYMCVLEKHIFINCVMVKNMNPILIDFFEKGIKKNWVHCSENLS